MNVLDVFLANYKRFSNSLLLLQISLTSLLSILVNRPVVKQNLLLTKKKYNVDMNENLLF